MAYLEGFEPPTFWSVARRSIQLSYRYACFIAENTTDIDHLRPFASRHPKFSAERRCGGLPARGEGGSPPQGRAGHSWTARCRRSLLATVRGRGQKKPASHRRHRLERGWWPEAGSNRRHRDFQSLALPTELSCHGQWRTWRDSNPRPSGP